jgi:ribonuclease G
VVPPAKLLVESDPLRLRIALLEGDRLAELHVDSQAPSRVGEIHLGRVRRLVPAIDAAFIDIGLERNAFLQTPESAGDGEPLTEQQELLVQIFRDEVPGKGARVRRGASLPGRHLVLLCPGEGVHVSSRITDAA